MYYNSKLLNEGKWVNKVSIFEEIDSTNTYLKSNLEVDKHLVLSYMQKIGKGRRGRTFISDNNGIYLSYLLKNLSDEKFKIITIIAAVAVCRSFKEVENKSLQVKWVNDLMINSLKVGGILCESIHSTERNTIVGIGINTLGVSKDISSIATHVDVRDYNGVVLAILKNINLLLNCDNFKIIDEYQRLLNHINKPVLVKGKEEYVALVVGVNEDGHLIVNSDTYGRHELCNEEVSICEII